MQYVFLIRSSAGGKKYVTRRSRVTYFLPPAYQKHVLHGPETVSIFIANLRAIFNDILRKISTIFYAKTWDSLYCGRSLDVVCRELIPKSRDPRHFSNPEIPGLSSPNPGIKLCRIRALFSPHLAALANPFDC